MITKKVSYKGCKALLPENVSMRAFKRIVEISSGFHNCVQPFLDLLSNQLKNYKPMNNENKNHDSRKTRSFILQKDLPNCKAGALFMNKYNDIYYYNDSDTVSFLREFVENNPEWFRLKKPGEEKPVVRKSEMVPPGYECFFKLSNGEAFSIDTDRLAEILLAEKNGELLLGKYWNPVSKPMADKDLCAPKQTAVVNGKTYTEKEFLEAKEKAFIAGRLKMMVNDVLQYTFPDFSDYINAPVSRGFYFM